MRQQAPGSSTRRGAGARRNASRRRRAGITAGGEDVSDGGIERSSASCFASSRSANVVQWSRQNVIRWLHRRPSRLERRRGSPRRTRVPKAGLSEARLSRGRTERVCADGTSVEARGGSAATAEDSLGRGTRGGVLVHQTDDRETVAGTETVPNNRLYDVRSSDCSSARPNENSAGRWQCATTSRRRWRGPEVQGSEE